jgi:superfamily II DNA/RNA helicase
VPAPTRARVARPHQSRSSSSRPKPAKVHKAVPVSTVPPLPTRAPQPPATSFADAGLPASLVKALAQRGMSEPFAIQAAALPDALAGTDILGRAQTGSGKTLGFGLPVLARLGVPKGAAGRPRAMVLVPTRELAQQVASALTPLAGAMSLTVFPVYGGAPIQRQISRLRSSIDVLVATPGRLKDLLERRALSLDSVEVAVLDEADQLCDLGFLPEMQHLLRLIPAGGQRMLFSATLDGNVDKLIREFLQEPVLVSIDDSSASVDTMEHHAFEVRDVPARLDVLVALLSTGGRALVFARTKHGTDRLAEQLSRRGVPAAALHGGMAQNARTRALAAFTDGSRRVLVATDVAARGIHVTDVRLVVHADMPEDPKTYLHRSGRTARAGADGKVVMLSFASQRRTAASMLQVAGVSDDVRPVTAADPILAELAGPDEVFAPVAPPREEHRQRPPRPAFRGGTPHRGSTQRRGGGHTR